MSAADCMAGFSWRPEVLLIDTPAVPTPECIGCKQIQEERFPFCCEDSVYSIDMEDCGIDSVGRRMEFLPIKYCPVCGVSLTVSLMRPNI
jgi:hypothetical protein